MADLYQEMDCSSNSYQDILREQLNNCGESILRKRNAIFEDNQDEVEVFQISEFAVPSSLSGTAQANKFAMSTYHSSDELLGTMSPDVFLGD